MKCNGIKTQTPQYLAQAIKHWEGWTSKALEKFKFLLENCFAHTFQFKFTLCLNLQEAL